MTARVIMSREEIERKLRGYQVVTLLRQAAMHIEGLIPNGTRNHEGSQLGHKMISFRDYFSRYGMQQGKMPFPEFRGANPKDYETIVDLVETAMVEVGLQI